MKVTAVVPAAGKGLRFSNNKKGPRKPFFIVIDKPILIHTLFALERSGYIDDIIVAVCKDDIAKCKKAIASFKVKKIARIVPGGKTRFESVKKGLYYAAYDSDIILIHDGARPLVDKRIIRDSIKACKRFGAAVAGIPVTSTIKSVKEDLIIKATADRKEFYIAQTPQVFKKDIILKAYKRTRNTNGITDDSMLVERLGHQVKIVPGSYRNIKITTQEDIILMEAILRKL